MSTLQQQARDLGDRRGLASDLAKATRDLSRLEQRVTVDAAFAVRLAAQIVQLEAIRKALPRAGTDTPQAKYFQGEFDSLSKGVNDALRNYALQTGDHRVSSLGLQKWASTILREWKAEADEKAARKTVRATFKASGTCRRCGKQSSTLNTADGICHQCFLRSQEVRGAKPARKTKALPICAGCGQTRERPGQGGLCSKCSDRFITERTQARRRL